MRTRVFGFGLLLAVLPPTGACRADTPDPAKSYFVVQSGAVATPTEGPNATRLLRQCPNNDGGSALPNNVRVKVKLKNSAGADLIGVAAADIFIRLNGGTAAQNFSGPGADSIVANNTYNTACPLLQYLFADAPSNNLGEAYITLRGGDPNNPGVALRDPNRKWGHYDSELPVFALGVQLQGRLTSNGNNGEYVLQIKNFDFRGGLGTVMNSGETVSSVDINSMNWNIGVSDPLAYWRDFDGNGVVNSFDLNAFNAHRFHDCDTPLNP